MTDPINVDVSAMLAAVVEFDDKHDNIRGQVTTVQSEFDGLSATWGGEAASAFQGAMHGFYEDCNTILATLQQIALSVDNSAIKYQQTHNLSTDAAMQLRQQINSQPAGLAGF
ncbi:WXG100 family type VII secretion target [Actinophytocola sp.]|jgi:WXG100 family type VII secretion target|uniref:WXG100 family type VII secretion target n=1 Tax=Actinophytocola sp. TaxID=1872138 RepID=UPI002D356B5D|nr:WXG100 family type VII secretion target [Actinophytocola sp.]HYQ64007.1 WXG100 family type VII secretion target [Actinophytocola sp.]